MQTLYETQNSMFIPESSQGSRNDLNASTDPKDVTTMLMKSAIVVCDGRSTELDGAYSPPKPLDPNGRSVNANKSVHYHHCSNGYSCHGRVEQSLCPPSWVHVFAKSTWPSSIRTQAASIAYIELPVHKKKVWHRRNRRLKKKLRKHQNLLTEVIAPPAIKQNLLSESDIDNEIVIVDGGDNGNPSIRPPDGLKWCCLSV